MPVFLASKSVRVRKPLASTTPRWGPIGFCEFAERRQCPDTALSKTNHALFDEIGKAMDQFVNLLVEHQTSAPDSAKFKAVYNAYLEKLKRAD